MNEPYNFDEQPVPEYFEFIVGGHKYRMRFPTTEELEKAYSFIDDPEKATEYQYSFVQAIEEGAPVLAENLKDKSIIIRNRINAAIQKEFQRES